MQPAKGSDLLVSAFAKIGRELHQVTGVLMNSLIWIYADFAGAVL